MAKRLGLILMLAIISPALAWAAEKPGRAVPLVNGGFEAETLPEGWTLHVYGAPPTVTLDGSVQHAGKKSLRVSADAPSDTAFGQELQLKPGQWYRLKGWVRTEKLDPCGSPTCGTFQIQHPTGNGVLTSGKNHAGTTDWTQETIYFTPPSTGLTRLAIFFVGYGKGTGTAWFDDITLEEVDVTASRLTVTPQPLTTGTISPFQGGQFIEYLCGLTLSMHAEKVFDGSFEGVAEFCRAMKAVDPSIKLMAAFPSPGVLQQAGQYLDYICPHHYGCHQLQAMADDVARCRRWITEFAPGKDIRLGITEWNTTAGDRGLGRAMLWTLDNALACSRYHNFMHRQCDILEIANRSNLTDSFCSGIIQTDNHRLFKTPTYYAQQLYATHAGQIPLTVETDAALPADPALDASATRTADGRGLSLFVVSYTNQPQRRTLDLTGLTPLSKEIEVWTLADTRGAGERDVANSWREPDRIRTASSRAVLVDGSLAYEFPALSLTVLKLRRENP